MIYHSPTKFYPNKTTHRKVMTSYRFIKLLKLRPYGVGNPLGFSNSTRLAIFRSISIRYFDKIAQTTAVLLLF